MRRNITSYTYSLVLLLLIWGCKKSPERVVERYLDHTFLNNNGKKAYKLLCTEDKMYKSEKEFIKEVKKANILNNKVIKKHEDKFSYRIVETKSHGDTTVVKVQITKPNAEDVLNEMVNFAMLTAFSKQNEEEKNYSISQKFNQLLLKNSMETITEEREYRVIKENNKYRLYLNLGLPFKLERQQMEIDKLKKVAEEQERVINYSHALDLYHQMQQIRFDEKVEDKIKNIEIIKKNSLKLKETRKFGNLEITPEKLEIRRVSVSKMDWYQGIPYKEISKDEYLVLTLTLKNASEDQFFAYEDENKYKSENKVWDNLGNTMSEFGPSYDIHCVEDNVYKKLSPGESRQIKVVCESPVKKANHFIWNISLYTDNQKTVENAYINFNREQILENLRLAQKE